MGILDIFKKGKDGKLQPANFSFNRHERRAMAALARKRPQLDRKFAAEKQHALTKKAIAERVKRKQDAAHSRAVARKMAKKSAFQGAGG